LSRLRSLDGLRALAVSMVFVHHVVPAALPGGALGVSLFFALSGYLITAILLEERERTGRISLPSFYARRALRLYPALIVLVVAATVAAWVQDVGNPVPDAIAALLYLTDFYAQFDVHLNLLLHTWSLAVEEQFYLVWPAVLIVGLARGWRLDLVTGVAILGGIASVAALELFVGADKVPYITFLPTSNLPMIGGGVLLALMLRTRRGTRLCARFSGTAAAAAALAVLGLGMVCGSAVAFAVLPVVVPVAHLLLHRESAISRVLSLRPVVWLGERSYGFYLWHYPVLLSLSLHVESELVVGLAGLAIVLAATELSWRYVELPFLRRKRRYQVIQARLAGGFA
jgi:peptidoglycan/LPS O-acetylase OafA/YrhL